MKRKRHGGLESGEICVVQVSPLLNQAFGRSVGATQDEIVRTAAEILHRDMGIEDVRREYNRSIQVSFISAPGGHPDAFARGFLCGLEHVRVGGRRDRVHAFDGALVRQRIIEMALDPSDTDGTSDTDEAPCRVAPASSPEESEVFEFSDDASYLLSGETSEQDE
jgi:hypothetical protein